jgi:hypothetical protein
MIVGEGRGVFPSDMLRYDACVPDSQEDIENAFSRNTHHDRCNASHVHDARWTTRWCQSCSARENCSSRPRRLSAFSSCSRHGGNPGNPANIGSCIDHHFHSSKKTTSENKDGSTWCSNLSTFALTGGVG